MNAQLKEMCADPIFDIQLEVMALHDSVLFSPSIVKKTDLLRQFRETKQTFLNLGSVLINQVDGTIYMFNSNSELVKSVRMQI